MIDLNGATLGITRDDGTDINIDIEPTTIEIDGNLKATGVYNLFDHEGKDLGQLAFSIDDPYEWIYNSNLLSDVEVEQVVRFIQKEDTL